MTTPCDGIPMSWVSRHCKGAVRQGLLAERLLGDARIDPMLLEESCFGTEIGAEQYMLFTMNTALCVEDALHGFGQDRIPIGYAASGIRVMLGCATLEGALRALGRFYAQTTATAVMHLDTEGGWAKIGVIVDGPSDGTNGILEDMALAWLFMCASRFLGRALPVAEVQVRDPQHFNLGGRHWAVKAPVRRSSLAGLRFPRALLAARRGGAPSDEALWPMVGSWLRFVAPGGSGGQSLELDAHSAVPNRMAENGQLLPAKRADRQRLIVDRGVGLLRSTNASVDAVAADLGYSDARSFRRFMKAATGRTPQQIREGSRTDVPANEIFQRIRRLAVLMDPGFEEVSNCVFKR